MMKLQKITKTAFLVWLCCKSWPTGKQLYKLAVSPPQGVPLWLGWQVLVPLLFSSLAIRIFNRSYTGAEPREGELFSPSPALALVIFRPRKTLNPHLPLTARTYAAMSKFVVTTTCPVSE